MSTITLNSICEELENYMLIKGIKKKEVKEVYDLQKEIQELNEEYEQKKGVFLNKIMQSDFYVIHGNTYCRFIEIINGHKLK